MPIRIVLADDHTMFREAMARLIGRQEGMLVVGSTGDGAKVPELVRQTGADVVLMDVRLPGINGDVATRLLLAEIPSVRVVAVSAFADQHSVMEMLSAGASGYVLKEAAADDLLRAIRAVAAGGSFLSHQIAAAFVSAGGDRSTKVLGKREREVLRLLSDGMSSPEIAAALYISQHTVEVHRRNIMQKLDLHNVAQLTKWAVRHGLTQC